MYKNITGIILAGGKSSRMGMDKALLKLGNETMIGRIANTLKATFINVIIIADRYRDFQFLELPIYRDIYNRKGPLSGIHSGLVNSRTEENFIISSDLPLISTEMISSIIEYKSNKPIKYFVAACKHQYLAGIYKKLIIPKIEKIFSVYTQSKEEKQAGLSVKNLLSEVEFETILADNLPFYKPETFFNVNTVDDYKLLVKYYSALN